VRDPSGPSAAQRPRTEQRRATRLGVLLGLLAGLATLAGAQTPAERCPPVPTPPTAEQVQAAQGTARDRGFLWRITKDGRASYLYGTIHVGKLEWVAPGPTIRGALDNAGVLALELDVSDPATLRKLQLALAPKTWDPPVAPALRRELAQQTAKACLPPGALDDQKPAAQAVTLAVLEARWEGLDAAYAQELVLGQIAQSRAVPIVALESVDEQVSALLPASAAETGQFIESALAQIGSGAARRATRRLAQAWAEGRLDELANYEQWCECVKSEDDRRLLRRLNDERNPALASRIDRVHGRGRSVFVGVGALHMTGPQALPQLLRQRGFDVERVELAH
jgi:uncharacterized protein YbaP (TraB family)